MPTIKLTGLSGGRPTTVGTTDDATLDGSLTIGDADTDSLVVNAEFASDLVPDDNNTYDLGSDTKRWNTVYAKSVSATDGFPSYIAFGKNNAQTAPLSNFELSTTNGSQNAQGWRMPVGGVVTHMTCQFDANQSGGTNGFFLVIWKNGVEQAGYQIALSDVASGDIGDSQEFGTPLAFSANDRLTIKLSMTVGGGGSFSMDDLACLLRFLN